MRHLGAPYAIASSPLRAAKHRYTPRKAAHRRESEHYLCIPSTSHLLEPQIPQRSVAQPQKERLSCQLLRRTRPYNCCETDRSPIKMSNAQVGNVYSQIIGDVIESSRVDFEEGGVDEAVLEELKTVRGSFIVRLSCPTQHSSSRSSKRHEYRIARMKSSHLLLSCRYD